MSIKGLKEALAKKQAQQHPESKATDTPAPMSTVVPTRSKNSSTSKKATGRGR